MDNLECRVIRIRTDNRRENWSRMPMNDDGLDITKFWRVIQKRPYSTVFENYPKKVLQFRVVPVTRADK